ncbi:polysaccharide deacetylase family protein, partial [Hungatella sp. SL.1.14]|uniref:polysaccharide deacetylase family protein n=1 Tax=Hungatella sp. SL.1.14 TaxID=2963703 RepID=UPI0032E50888
MTASLGIQLGNRVPGTQAVVQRMNALRCEVANHTYEHKYLTKAGDAGIRSRVGLTNQKITEA